MFHTACVKLDFTSLFVFFVLRKPLSLPIRVPLQGQDDGISSVPATRSSPKFGGFTLSENRTRGVNDRSPRSSVCGGKGFSFSPSPQEVVTIFHSRLFCGMGSRHRLLTTAIDLVLRFGLRLIWVTTIYHLWKQISIMSVYWRGFDCISNFNEATKTAVLRNGLVTLWKITPSDARNSQQ